MKSILCFGDSNTWGYDPATKTRFSRNIRWTGVLQNCLEDDFYIIEEGLNVELQILMKEKNIN